MKLNEVKLLKENWFTTRLNAEGFLTDEKDIRQWCEDNSVRDCTISSAGEVSVSSDLTISSFEAAVSHCPVQFSHVTGKLSVNVPAWTSLKGLPKSVGGAVMLSDLTGVRSLEFAPESSGGWYSLPPKIESFVDISDRIKSMNGQLYIGSRNVRNGGLGILLIDGIIGVEGIVSKIPRPLEIIRNYLRKPDDIFQCQTELIEAGFGEYAVL